MIRHKDAEQYSRHRGQDDRLKKFPLNHHNGHHPHHSADAVHDENRSPLADASIHNPVVYVPLIGFHNRRSVHPAADDSKSRVKNRQAQARNGTMVTMSVAPFVEPSTDMSAIMNPR